MARKSRTRKYSDAQLEKIQQMLDAGMAPATINAKIPSAIRSLAAYKKRMQNPTPAQCDVLYCASYYRNNNLPSPYDNVGDQHED